MGTPALLPLAARKPVQTPGAFAPIADLPIPSMQSLDMGGPVPSLGPLVPPAVASNPRMGSSAADPLTARAGDLEADIYRREHPIAPTTTLGKIGHVAAGIGNVLGDIFAPSTMSLIPGTELGNRVRIGEDQKNLQDVSSLQNQAAQRAQTEASTAYTQARPQIEQAKILQKLTSSLAPKGIIATMNPDGTIDTQDDPESAAYHSRIVQDGLKAAQAERDQVLSQMGQPGSPLYEQKQQQLNQIDKRIGIAQQALGLHGAEVGLKRDSYLSANYGVGPDGKTELPGVLHDEAGTAVGHLQAHNVTPTTNARDAASRAEDMTGIQSRIESALADPDIQDYMGPVGGRLAEAQGQLGTLPTKVAQFQNDLVSYGAFQAGLHPVRGIGALQYFDKVMGGLHQTPEQLRGKLQSNAATAGTVQQEGVMPTRAGQARKQSAPNSPSVMGGGANSVKKYNPKTGRLE